MIVIPRSVWGAAPPTSPLIPVTWKLGTDLWLHHTVTAYIEPEGDPPSMAGKLVWVGKQSPNMRTIGIRNVGKTLSAPVLGKDGKWRVYAVPSANKAKRAEWLARVTRSKAAERRAMREIQAFHQHGRGWSDIGYAYTVFPSGRCYVGRGAHIGAHCPGHNREPSVALVGDYSKRSPTKDQIAAVKALQLYITAAKLKGHRSGFPTSCPGDAAMEAFGL